MAYLSRLSLSNFRNLAHLELELPPGVVVFFGGNAQGKTTLLEAIYLLAIARSFRAENEREVVSFQAAARLDQAVVGGTIEREGSRFLIRVGYQCVAAPDEGHAAGADGLAYSVRKQIRVGRLRRTAAQLVGTVNAVLFSAGDIQLVTGPPSGRRRYLDIMMSQVDPIYLRGLQRHQRVVQQRNHLLRMLREGRAGSDELAFWDQELAREGAAITWARHQLMGTLSRVCDRQHQELAGQGDELRMEYRPSVAPGDGPTDTERRFRDALAAWRPRELAAATTLVGPHRDDFKLLLAGVDMGTFASRGQARTLALTLRLGEAHYLASTRGEAPIVLLDDVLSEMDGTRRRRVLERSCQHQQVLITTTDLELVKGFFGGGATYFRVGGGKVCPLADEPGSAAKEEEALSP